MSDGIYAALSGAVAQGMALDSTATNVANAATAGYHGQRPVFHEMLSRAGGSTLRYTAASISEQTRIGSRNPVTSVPSGDPIPASMKNPGNLGKGSWSPADFHAMTARLTLLSRRRVACLGDYWTYAMRLRPRAQRSSTKYGWR